MTRRTRRAHEELIEAEFLAAERLAQRRARYRCLRPVPPDLPTRSFNGPGRLAVEDFGGVEPLGVDVVGVEVAVLVVPAPQIRSACGRHSCDPSTRCSSTASPRQRRLCRRSSA